MQYSTLLKRGRETLREQGVRKSFFIFLQKAAMRMSVVSLNYDPYYLFRKAFYGYATPTINGFTMYLDLREDTGISKDLFLFHKREHLSTDYLLSHPILGSGDTVLDVGANIGYYALMESKLVGPKGKVYALEPVAENMRMLEKNIAINKADNIETFRLAAGSEKKMDTIYVASKGNLSSFFFREGVTGSAKEEVQIVTIDDFVSDHNIRPALVRMDVEGYESEIIEGMHQTFKTVKPKLLIEIHPFLMRAERTDKLLSTIQQHGYTNAVVISERELPRIKRNGNDSRIFKYLERQISGRETPQEAGDIRTMSLDELRSYLQKGLQQKILDNGATNVHALIT